MSSPVEGLRLKVISSAYALYHERSGQTHIIGEEARAILDALRAGPLSAAQILEQLGLRYDLDVGDAGGEAAMLARLTGRLRELEHWGLVRALAQ